MSDETKKSSVLYSVLAASNSLPVLVIDDDRFSREICRASLVKAGYEVLTAEDGKQAFEIIREQRPQVVISDWMMPEMDGVTLCRKVKADPALEELYFIILTARDETDDLVDAFDAGADDYLPKPWNPRELLARVRAGLRTAELQSALTQRGAELSDLNNRLRGDLTVVSNMQKAMLPQTHPESDAFEFTAFYFPSAEGSFCGGDYYDFLQLDDRHLGFVIADVSGHGAPAMVTMALIRQNIHIIARNYAAPHLLLEELNRLLWDHLPTDQFATMFYAIIDNQTLEMHYASAGHNPPVLYQTDKNETAQLPHCESFPLKLVTRDVNYFSHSVQLRTGDRMVFYTDGIPECFNAANDTYGMERFEETIQKNAGEMTPGQLQNALIMDLMQFADGREADDDVTLAILGVR